MFFCFSSLAVQGLCGVCGVRTFIGGASEGIAFLFSHLALFFLVFDISFVGFESVTTARVSLVLLFIFYWRRAWFIFRDCVRSRPLFFVNLLFLTLYSVVLVLLNGSSDKVVFSRFFWFFCYSLVGGFLVIAMFGFSLRRLLVGFLVVMLAQSFFVYLSLVFEGYRLWVSESIVNGSNIDFLTRFRSPGFSSTGGADLSVKLALGCVSSLLLYASESCLRNKVVYISCFFFTFGAVFFVGRTGMLIVVFFLLSFLLYSLKAFKLKALMVNFLLAFFVGSCALFFSVYFLERLIFSIGDVFEWAVYSIVSNEDKTIDTLVGQLETTPQLDFFSILLGTGRVRFSDGLNFSGSDSGYVQTFFAIGGLFSVSFYLSLLLFFLSLVSLKGRSPFFSVLLIFMCFFVEIKESFLFKYTLPMFVFCYLVCVKVEVGAFFERRPFSVSRDVYSFRSNLR